MLAFKSTSLLCEIATTQLLIGLHWIGHALLMFRSIEPLSTLSSSDLSQMIVIMWWLSGHWPHCYLAPSKRTADESYSFISDRDERGHWHLLASYRGSEILDVFNRGLVKIQGFLEVITPHGFWFSEWGKLRIYISNKFPGDVETTDPENTLWGVLV